jgi:hypothetical protein
MSASGAARHGVGAQAKHLNVVASLLDAKPGVCSSSSSSRLFVFQVREPLSEALMNSTASIAAALKTPSCKELGRGVQHTARQCYRASIQITWQLRV